MPENTENTSSNSTLPPELSYANIRAKVQEKFQKRPCRWQCQVAQSIMQGQDVIIAVGTGMGKTLAFFISILFSRGKIQIIVTALNVLGKQNVDQLEKAGISAISISADTATHDNFRAIEDGKHQVVIVSPEQIMKPGGGFEKLFKKADFTSRIISVVFDEAHCITQWGSFRPEYRELSRLRYLIPKIPFVLASE
ncbi:hypothetical protein NLI96_g12939 [Meripilus lineatus]|uniref:DNA 3'-5' helicase n=1 Tax=Meripilus lineatus TaxID=2056292 RepID=A0AAD5Y756_9APHY|nr:hypothetical protein NLI96_g12939 [Physisporinus lineatus]